VVPCHPVATQRLFYTRNNNRILTELHFNFLPVLYRSDEATTSLQNSVRAQPLESGAFLFSFFLSFLFSFLLSFLKKAIGHVHVSAYLRHDIVHVCSLTNTHTLTSTCAETPSYSSLASMRISSLLMSLSFFLALSHSLAVCPPFSLLLSLSRSLVLALSFSPLLAHVGARACTFFLSLTIGEGIGGRAADGEGTGSVVYREGHTM